jgi:hypothetical protein
VDVFVGGDAIQLIRRRGGLRASVPEEISVPLSTQERHGEPWKGLAEDLDSALAGAGWRKARAAIVLSNHHVRYSLAPALPGLRKVERAAAARHHLGVVYGDRIGRWAVRTADDPGGDRMLAAAVDPDLIAAVSGALRARDVQPGSMRPYLAEAYDLARRRMAKGPAWLAAIEPGRLCVAHLDGGRWRALRSQRQVEPPSQALPALLEQVRLSAEVELAPGTLYAVCRGVSLEGVVLDGRWRLEVIPA